MKRIFSVLEGLDPVTDDAVDKSLTDALREDFEVRAIGSEITSLIALVLLVLLTGRDLTVEMQLVHTGVLQASVLAMFILGEGQGKVSICEHPQVQVLEA